LLLIVKKVRQILCLVFRRGTPGQKRKVKEKDNKPITSSRV
jgi:hypothetical protein